VPNNYFRFKQFWVKQDKCAMKVCTDSCILGAYTPVTQAQTVLDIGTGTGLLALMVAQRSAAHIQALEIDDQAATQARENIAQSPWNNRILVTNQSLQAFAQVNQQLFDLIICNPPFYTASQQSPDQARNVAMHSQELTLGDIAIFCGQFLTPNGKLYVLLPPAESRHFTNLAQAENLHWLAGLQIFTSIGGKHIRTIQGFGRKPSTNLQEERLFIRNADNTYTGAFQKLLQEYYLIF
jgi:tRNA1Val (adenine37-N6)-methyltransferase